MTLIRRLRRRNRKWFADTRSYELDWPASWKSYVQSPHKFTTHSIIPYERNEPKEKEREEEGKAEPAQQQQHRHHRHSTATKARRKRIGNSRYDCAKRRWSLSSRCLTHWLISYRPTFTLPPTRFPLSFYIYYHASAELFVYSLQANLVGI